MIHELRLGNVFINADGRVSNCGQLQNNFLGVGINGRGPIGITPFPLSDLVLEACGFSKTADGSMVLDVWTHGGRYRIWYYPNEIHPIHLKNWLDKDDGEKSSIFQSLPHIKSLHQLQNLYYILCGRELRVDEDILTDIKNNFPIT